MRSFKNRYLALSAVLLCLSFEARAQSTTKGSAEVLTLQQAIELALRENRQIYSASLDVMRSTEATAASRLRRLPTFNVDIFAAQQLTPIDFTFERGVFGTYPGIGPVPAENTKLSTPMKPTAVFTTRITQPLSTLYKINLGLRQSELNTEIAREELRAKQQQVTRDVKRGYFALLQTQSALASAQETVRMYRELDRVTGNYLAQEVVLKSDSLDVKSRLAKSESDAITLVDQFGIQKQQLNLLLGRDVMTDFSVVALTDADNGELDLAAARRQALELRPEIREARLKMRQSDLDRRIKKAEYIPEINATFQYVVAANFNNVIPKSYMNIGLSVSWEVFDWGRKKHELAEKEFASAQAKSVVRDAESKVLIEVNDSFNKVRQARRLFAVSELNREAAAENVRVLTNRYKVQMSLLSDVLRAHTQLEELNNQKTQALLGLWTALAEYETALGEDK
ncbi:MAG TPA: TolC family protein [Blastocatellia bacterium]|nr:TolC family protein [Blastocatellia bacterium]